MATTYTSLLNLAKPGIGESRDAWGGLLNGDFDTIDTAIKNRRVDETPVTGGTTSAFTVTLSQVPALYDGLTFKVRLNAQPAASATLNVNGLGAKIIHYVHAVNGYSVLPNELMLAGEIIELSYYAAGNSGAGAFVVVSRATGKIIDLQYIAENTAGSASATTTPYAVAAGAGASILGRRDHSSALVHWIARIEINPGTNTTKDVAGICVMKYYDGSAYQILGSSTTGELLHTSLTDTTILRGHVSGHCMLTTSQRRSDSPTIWTIRPYGYAEYSGNTFEILSWSAQAIVYTP